jgi:hypothetical protein
MWASTPDVFMLNTVNRGSIIDGLRTSMNQLGDCFIGLVRDSTESSRMVKGIKTFRVETLYPILESSYGAAAGFMPTSSFHMMVTFSLHELISHVTGIPAAHIFLPLSDHNVGDKDPRDMQHEVHEDRQDVEDSGLDSAMSILVPGLPDCNENPIVTVLSSYPWPRDALLRWRRRAGDALSGRMSQLRRLQREARINLMKIAITAQGDAPSELEVADRAIRVTWPDCFKSNKTRVCGYISCFIDWICPLQARFYR